MSRVFVSYKTEDFGPYFSGRRKLLPRHSDLSFYNWDTNYSTSNSTANYQVRREEVEERGGEVKKRGRKKPGGGWREGWKEGGRE